MLYACVRRFDVMGTIENFLRTTCFKVGLGSSLFWEQHDLFFFPFWQKRLSLFSKAGPLLRETCTIAQ